MDVQGNAVEPEDFRDDYYCEHGTFIGNPYGGDYLCGWCEDGTPIEEFRQYCHEQEMHARRKNIAYTWFNNLPESSSKIGPNSLVLGIMLAFARYMR